MTGQPHAARPTRRTETELPAGTVTFVLGDIAGSTRLWERCPEHMPAVLARLDALVEGGLRRHGGQRPAEQGEGDNFVAAFPKAFDAVEFATVLQRELTEERWAGGLDVSVRMAVHTGDARRRDSGRYMGETLNRCARLRALGHGGQVLVSSTSAGLVAEHLAGGTFLRDLGAHHLRDLSQPERISQLCGPGLPFEFPPLRSLDRMLNNLPIQITSFVGRAAELAETTLLLADRRLLTLAGAGGCGKTRLAVQLAAESIDAFPDGVWFADLAPVTDPDLVASTLASAAGIGELPGQALVDTLRDRLAGSHALVVLDNCEHLLASAADLSETLLRACPGVRVLATSREPLGAEGETTYRVPSLGLPTAPDDAGCESVTLFAERAALSRPSMRVGAAELSAMTAICTRLDGMPLAIELAAARCRALTLPQIAELLSHHFGLLTGGSRRALPRHRALDASIEWSYGLLDEGEALLLRQLAVFAGGFTLDAAEAVGSCEGETWTVLDRLTSLIDKSLVQESEHGRYRLLEAVRQFAENRLNTAGEGLAARRRHLEYFARLAEAAEPDLYGPDLVATRQRMDLELDNLRAAGDWALEAGDVDAALRLTLPLGLFWQTHLTEAHHRLERLLAQPGAAPELRLFGLSMAAEVECIRGDIERLCALTEEAFALLDGATDPAMRGYLLVYAGWGKYFLGDSGAEAVAHEGVALLRAAGDARSGYCLLDGLWALGMIASAAGRTDQAFAYYRESLAAAHRSGTPIGIGRGQTILGFTLAIHGEFAEARPMLASAARLLEACGDEIGIWATCGLALVDGLTGDATATDRLRAAVAHARDRQQGLAVAWGAWALGLLEAREGTDEREAALDEAEAMMEATGFLWGAAWAQALRAEHHLARGDVPAARAAAQQALTTSTSGSRAELARGAAELAGARVARAAGDRHGAEEAAHRALAAFAAAKLPLQTAEALEFVAGLAAEQGGTAEAARLFAAAGAWRGTRPCPPSPAEAARLEADHAAVRVALDPAIFEATWAKGATMTLDDAVAVVSRGRGPRRRPSSGWQSLTPTELEVVGLVAEGLRNPEIAAKLFVSTETVKTHVSSALAKLGATNRTEIAAIAARRA